MAVKRMDNVGERITIDDLTIEAVPMYNPKPDPQHGAIFHPRGVAEIVPNTQPRFLPCVFNDLQHRVISLRTFRSRYRPSLVYSAVAIAAV